MLGLTFKYAVTSTAPSLQYSPVDDRRGVSIANGEISKFIIGLKETCTGLNQMSDKLGVDTNRTALVLMDFQNDIVTKGGALAASEDDALERIDKAIASANNVANIARGARVPVIHVAVGRKSGDPPQNPHMPIQRYIAQTDALVHGSNGFAFHPDAQPGPGEAIIVKRSVSAFAGTDLAAHLQGQGIDTLVLCGFATHMVVEGTARDAADRGYRVIVLEDCCASGGLDRHTAALQNIGMIGEVGTSQEFLAAIE